MVDTFFRRAAPEEWDEMERRILQAADKKETKLVLSSEKLASIPSFIGMCSNLQILDVFRFPHLLTLPKEIGLLSKLQKVNSYCSRIMFYPFELVHVMKSLKPWYMDCNSYFGRNPFPDIPVPSYDLERVASESLSSFMPQAISDIILVK